jgi:pimeloyl-ACP methyl ester carboxylesterase
MTTYALVHGAGHGAWCWERLVPRLEKKGHRAVTMDLPCADSTATYNTYADVVIASLARSAGDVVLVGHSLGGLTVPLVAARRPVKSLVFLSALLPIPGQVPFGPDPDAPPQAAPGLDLTFHGDGTFSFTPASAATHLYNRCAPADVKWATARLRPQSPAPNSEACPLAAWPDVERTYIACRDDRIVMPDYARYAARTRAGIDVTMIDADHSSFLSNPDALADLLISFA